MKNNSSPDRATMSAKLAAAYVGVSYWKVLEMAKSNEIKHIRIGGRVLFRKQSLDDFLEEQEQNSSNRQTRNNGVRKLR